VTVCAGVKTEIRWKLRAQRRRILIDGLEEWRSPTIDRQPKHVRPVVVTGEIMAELHLDAELEIQVGIQDVLRLTVEWSCEYASVGTNNHRTAANVGAPQEFLVIRSSMTPEALITKAFDICAKALAIVREISAIDTLILGK